MQDTKKALADALKQQMSKKPLSKVTVSDLVAACGISRMTFYYHFRDIYDLVRWTCETDAQAILDLDLDRANWQAYATAMCVTLKENRAYVYNLYHSISRDQLEQFMYSALGDFLRAAVDRRAEALGLTVAEEDRAFIARYNLYSVVGFLLDWVRYDMHQDPEEIIRQASRLNEVTIDAPLQALSASHSA